MTRSEPVVNASGARSAGPRSRIPTEAELHEWYVRLRADPEGQRLRREIGIPIVRVIVSQKGGLSAASHGTIDGETPVCGRAFESVWVDPPHRRVVQCQKCLRIIQDEGYDYDGHRQD